MLEIILGQKVKLRTMCFFPSSLCLHELCSTGGKFNSTDKEPPSFTDLSFCLSHYRQSVEYRPAPLPQSAVSEGLAGPQTPADYTRQPVPTHHPL